MLAHFDYEDVIYDQLSCVLFANEVESMYHNMVVVITGVNKAYLCD